LLKKLDRSVLAAWVIAEDLHRQAVLEVNRRGLVMKSPVKGEIIQNPWLPIVNRQAQIMMKAGAELGFTPSSRSRVSMSEEDTNEQNPFAEFKRG
jgi:P27 family predicted phage terminase small subunit